MSTDWPALTRQSRPWTRWWWLGSAANEAEISRQLTLFHEAGLGGVEISPIYGVPGEEERGVSFLSPRWMELWAHTRREAERLDLGVDLICGTGWPFGGPWVPDHDAPVRVLLETFTLAPGGRAEAPIRSRTKPDAARLVALTARSPTGQTLNLTNHVDTAAKLDWTAPPSGDTDGWTLHAAFEMPTGQQVKRAAPGGEGNVVNPFSRPAVARYLARFHETFARLPAGQMPRCWFNDSYEVFGADWTPDLFDEFEKRRGYDLRQHFPDLRGASTGSGGDADIARRVRSDYRQTMSDLLWEFAGQWTDWARGKGAMARYQAHGSPGNLLDLYALADIPETELFGPATLRLAGREPLGTPPPPGRPAADSAPYELLACQLASSAAHVAGRPLCSAESCTWLGEHGHVPLDHVKAQTDLLFTRGINHVFFHGTPYSPGDAPWPGWLFYASTHFGPTNPFWRDLSALNAYVARCQGFLQAGRPDNDVLLYFPIWDLWASEGGPNKELLPLLAVGNAGQWLGKDLQEFTQTARRLQRGWGFDFVSDRLLAECVSVSSSGRLSARGDAAYRVLLLAGAALLPPETLERIVELARTGATVLVVGDLPDNVPGQNDRDARTVRLRAAAAALGPRTFVQAGVTRAAVGTGQFLFGPDVERLLDAAGVAREAVVDHGVAFVRRRGDGGAAGSPHHYFFAHFGGEPLDGWVSLAVPAASAVLFDPMNGSSGAARVRQQNGHAQVYLQMAPGESRLLRVSARPASSGNGREAAAAPAPAWNYLSPAGRPQTLHGAWQVTFVDGGPALPRPAVISALTSWTEWASDDEQDDEQRGALQAFCGTARYTTTFDKPAAHNADAAAWALDLGTVCHSARVWLNGQELGTLVARPFRLALPAGALSKKANQLTIEVTNLMANRLADLDRRKMPWRRFFFVNSDYKPFDASGWEPLPSGLLGPVQLSPLQPQNR